MPSRGAAWDRLLGVTARPTPFSRWTVHRAWWDAYGSTAHEQYLVCARAEPGAAGFAADDIVAIVPLMHRHEVEPEDAASLHPPAPPVDGTPVRPDATAVFMAASYHADYATILCPSRRPAGGLRGGRGVPGVAGSGHRAVGCHRPAPTAGATTRPCRPCVGALPAGPPDWTVQHEQEDVCPVVDAPRWCDWDDYLATLDKKARHEIRRKLRRAEAAGAITFRQMPLDAASVDAFIDLHQARWGEPGPVPGHRGWRPESAIPASR